MPGDGMHSIACNVVSIVVDEEPYNEFENTGVSCQRANAQVWRIKFNTNGTMPPREIVTAACNNIINRLEYIKKMFHLITNIQNEYTLRIDGESHTIGVLFERTMYELYPEADITAAISNVSRSVVIRIRCNDDITEVYNTIINHLVKIFGVIRKAFES